VRICTHVIGVGRLARQQHTAGYGEDCGVTIVFADQYRFIDLANQLDGF